MSLDQKMIISLMHALGILNVRFRAKDMTDSTRESLRPLIEDLDLTSVAYIRILREPGNNSSSKKLTTFRTLAKAVKKAKIADLVIEVTAFCAFLKQETGGEEPAKEEETEDTNNTDTSTESDTAVVVDPSVENTKPSDVNENGDPSTDSNNG